MRMSHTGNWFRAGPRRGRVGQRRSDWPQGLSSLGVSGQTVSALPSWLEDEPEQSRDDGSHFGEEARPLHATAERQASDLEQASTDGRRPRIGVLPLLVFCLVALGAVGSFVLFHQKVSADERRLLEVRARETTALFESFSEGTTRRGAAEIELLTRDGDRAALELSTRRVEVDGRTVAVQGIGRDVRERKRLQ